MKLSIFYKNMIKIVFFFVSVMSMMMMVFSNSILLMWFGLELNLYSIIPLLMKKNMMKVKYDLNNVSVIYFIFQCLGSMIFISGFIIPNYYSLSNVGLLIKMGVFPMLFWFPYFIESLNWMKLLIFSTVQKIGLLFILSKISIYSKKMILMMLIFSSMLSFLGMYNSNSVKMLLGWSSVFHSMYMMVFLNIDMIFSLMYFFFSMLNNMVIICFFFWNGQDYFNVNQSKEILVIISFLNLMGLPPFGGFLMKMVVFKMLDDLEKWYFIILVILSMIFISQIICYMKFILNQSKNNNNKVFNKYKYNYLIILLLIIYSIFSFSYIYF